MSNIQTVDARPLFTKMLVDRYREVTTPTDFLKSFFNVVESNTKEVSIEVKRLTEKIAVDVFRGTEGRRNRVSRSSEKIIIPPYYREFLDATELDLYDHVFGEGAMPTDRTFANFLSKVTEEMVLLQEKIERSIELQCSQVLQTGIVQLEAATNIDFKRKSASIVDLGGGEYWSTGTNDPISDIEDGCNFIRQNGKSPDAIFNMIMGSNAFEALLNNTTFQNRAEIRRFALDDINTPQRDAAGSSFHGVLSAGSYVIRIWTYPQFYDNASGVSTAYINTNNIIIIPERPRFTLAFGSVPHIMRDTENAEIPEFITNQRGMFMLGNYIDDRASSHIFDIKSAPIAIPTAVDTIYTAQVLA